MELNEHLDSITETIADGFDSDVEVIDCDTFPEDFYAEVPKWKRITDVVALVADLKNSTKLSVNRHPKTSARIYEGATGALVEAVKHADFASSFEQIQGDGIVALFHGEFAVERALCAGVTIKTFSVNELVPRITKQWGNDMPDTGFKVGLASGTVMAKKVGVRGTNEPIWSGKPVNWATKCAQFADAHELVVTKDVWESIKGNEYVTLSCGCNTGDGLARELWTLTTNDRLPDDHNECWSLLSAWCSIHGQEYATAILNGERERPAGDKAA